MIIFIYLLFLNMKGDGICILMNLKDFSFRHKKSLNLNCLFLSPHVCPENAQNEFCSPGRSQCISLELSDLSFKIVTVGQLTVYF